MPGSHGGGFGGGGFSGGGGSFHGGSHGKVKPQETMSLTRQFENSTRYYYVNNVGAMCYFYYLGSPKRMKAKNVYLQGIIMILVAIFIFSVVSRIMLPHKLSESLCNSVSECYTDNANVVQNPDILKEEFNQFYATTGVQPYLYTETDNTMTDPSSSWYQTKIMSRAYDKYLELFDDEGHYLIYMVFNTSGSEWAWCDMAGDDTNNIITESDFEKLQSYMYKYLNNEEYSIDESVALSIKELTHDAMTLDGDLLTSYVMMVIISVVFLAFGIKDLVTKIKQSKVLDEYCTYRDNNGGADFYDNSKSEQNYQKNSLLNNEKDDDIFS